MILFNAILRLQEKDIPGARDGLARIEKTDPKALPTVELKARILHAEGKDPEAEALIRAAFEARRAAPDALASGVGLLKLLAALIAPRRPRRSGPSWPRSARGAGSPSPSTSPPEASPRLAREQLDLASKAGAVDEATRASLNLANDLGGGWVDQTERLLGLALKGKPESLELLQMQAYLRHIQRDYSAEINTYQDILAKNPGNLLFLNNMAWTLSEEMGRGQEGFEQIERAIAKVGRQSHLVDTRGVILLRLGRVPEAIKDLEDAAGMLPTGPIYYHLARAYKMAGREADSDEVFRPGAEGRSPARAAPAVGARRGGEADRAPGRQAGPGAGQAGRGRDEEALTRPGGGGGDRCRSGSGPTGRTRGSLWRCTSPGRPAPGSCRSGGRSP